MNVIQEINRINQKELQQGITNTPASWHNQYASSAWVYIGNLPLQLSEGDVLAVMSQWGEIEDINLVREESTGKSKGFAFVKYEDCRSCVLAVDNFNGVNILGRSLRVDHVENYRLPKHLREKEKEEEVEEGKKDASRDGEIDHERIGDETRPSPPVDDRGELKPGHAYHGKVFKNDFDIHQGQDLFAPPAVKDAKNENTEKNSGAIVTEEERKLEKLQRKAERDRIRREREIRRQEREERKRRKRAKEMEHDGLDPMEESEERSSKHERKKKKEDKQRHSRHRSRRKEQRERRSLSRSTSVSRSSRDDASRRRYDSE